MRELSSLHSRRKWRETAIYVLTVVVFVVVVAIAIIVVFVVVVFDKLVINSPFSAFSFHQTKRAAFSSRLYADGFQLPLIGVNGIS